MTTPDSNPIPNANPKLPAVEIAVRTDPGRDPDKQVNEDSSFYKETAHGLLAVVCDGMGGHAGGREASELAIQTIEEVVLAAPAATPPAIALKRAVEEANTRIWSMPTAEAGYRPGSTVVAVLAHNCGAEVAHVGDSRLYLVHAGAISQVTRDHSMVQEMVDRNLIRPEDASKHPDANKILRALGIGKDVEVDLRPEPVAYVSGDIFVLCSDGLSDLVEPAEILEIAGTHPPAQAAGRLVDLANARGGHDNITAMVVQMKTTAALPAPPPMLRTLPLNAMTPTLPDLAPGPTGTMMTPPMAGASGGQPPSSSTIPVPGPAVGAPAAVPAHPPTVINPHGMGGMGGGMGGMAGGGMGGLPPQGPPRMMMPSHPHNGHGPVIPLNPSSVTPYPPRSRAPVLVIGIVLALVAVGIVGSALILILRPGRREVPVVDDHREASASIDSDSGAPEQAVAPAPTLSADLSARPSPGSPDAGRPFDPCAAARRARERDASATTIERLDARCKASGGGASGGGGGGGGASPTPTPTPTPTAPGTL